MHVAIYSTDPSILPPKTFSSFPIIHLLVTLEDLQGDGGWSEEAGRRIGDI